MKYPARSGSTSRAAGPWSHGPSSPAEFSRRALGLLGSRLGRLLGLGPGRKRIAHAWLTGTAFPALGNDAGEARDVEDVEYVAGLRHVLAGPFWNVPDPQRHHQFGTRLRAVFPSEIGSPGSWRSFDRYFCFFSSRTNRHLRSEHQAGSPRGIRAESSFLFKPNLLFVLLCSRCSGYLIPEDFQLVPRAIKSP